MYIAVHAKTYLFFSPRVPLNLQMKRITIVPPAPEVVSAVLNRYGDILVIKFDRQVEFDANCSSIISWPWTSNDSKCELYWNEVFLLCLDSIFHASPE